jgi:hypothetical protein
MIRLYTIGDERCARAPTSAPGDKLTAALAQMGASVAAREAAERARAEAQAAAAAEAARREAAAARRFVPVPNVLLGPVLDGGRASAYGAHLLAIKARHGAGFALQETHVACTYGIGRRGFRQGIARLRDAGAITTAEPSSPDGPSRRPQRWRGRPGHRARPWAAEAMTAILQPGARGWVALPERLLAEDSFTVALVLTVLLSPAPVRPAVAARRFGVTSRTTVGELVRAAVATGAVVQTRGAHGAILLGRPVTPAAPAPDRQQPVQLSRIVPSRIVPPYRKTATCKSDGRDLPPQPPMPRCARRGGSEGEEDYLIEALRQQGKPAHVVDLLAWFAAEGLGWWPDRLAVAQRLCTDLAGASPRAVASVRHELLAGQTHRMPPPPVILAAVRRAEAYLGEQRQDRGWIALAAARIP